jgi:hypothetical protein
LLRTQREWPERLILATPLYVARSHLRPGSWIARRRDREYRRQTA